MTQEQWRPIEGYEGLYEVSNMGRVKSIGYGKEKILKPQIINNGYLQVDLHKEGKGKSTYVHRLVGKAFIPNPEGLPQINHKDEDKTNNVVFLKDDGSVDECQSNLEWCDGKYNMNYGTHNERAGKNSLQTNIRNGRYDPELCGLTEKERKRRYYQKKKEKIDEQHREYNQRNREKIRERRREYMREYRRRKKQVV